MVKLAILGASGLVGQASVYCLKQGWFTCFDQVDLYARNQGWLRGLGGNLLLKP